MSGLTQGNRVGDRRTQGLYTNPLLNVAIMVSYRPCSVSLPATTASEQEPQVFY